MKIAVLGSGNGGCAAAFDWSHHGHQISLLDFETFPHNIRTVKEKGGVEAVDKFVGFASVHFANDRVYL